MLFGLLVTLFIIVCILLVLIIFIQKAKSSAGLGSLGGSTQLIFGGSGGQDLFQKITWGLGAAFMIGSLMLALMNSSGGATKSRYLADERPTMDKVIEKKNAATPTKKSAS